MTDEALLTAAHRAMGEVGPQQLTLSHVAHQAGVTPATLIHRFGSREILLLKLSEMITAAIENRSSQPPTEESALAEIFEFVRNVSGIAESPSVLANHLAFLQVELASTPCRAYLERRQEALRAGIKARLDAAIASGEILGADSDRLTALVQVTLTGTQICWLLKADCLLSEQAVENVYELIRPYMPHQR